MTTDIIVGSRAKPNRISRARWKWRPRPSTTALIRSYFPRVRAQRLRRAPKTSCRRRSLAERFERLRQVVERSALRRHEARVGLTEEVLVEGQAKKGGPGVYSGRTRQNKLVHVEAAGLRAGMVVEVGGRVRRPPFPQRKIGAGPGAASPSQPDTGGGQLSAHDRSPGPFALVGPTASGKSALGVMVALATG